MTSRTVPRIPSIGNTPAPTIRHERSASLADDIDFEIKGAEMQFVEIELDPGESAVAEAGSMMFKDPDIEMTTVFGDGSNQEAGKRLITGETLFTTVFTHKGTGKARAGFAAPYP
ncbi:MAG: AIM24 family protein, partial [Rhizobiaceae bacterium]